MRSIFFLFCLSFFFFFCVAQDVEETSAVPNEVEELENQVFPQTRVPNEVDELEKQVFPQTSSAVAQQQPTFHPVVSWYTKSFDPQWGKRWKRLYDGYARSLREGEFCTNQHCRKDHFWRRKRLIGKLHHLAEVRVAVLEYVKKHCLSEACKQGAQKVINDSLSYRNNLVADTVAGDPRFVYPSLSLFILIGLACLVVLILAMRWRVLFERKLVFPILICLLVTLALRCVYWGLFTRPGTEGDVMLLVNIMISKLSFVAWTAALSLLVIQWMDAFYTTFFPNHWKKILIVTVIVLIVVNAALFAYSIAVVVLLSKQTIIDIAHPLGATVHFILAAVLLFHTSWTLLKVKRAQKQNKVSRSSFLDDNYRDPSVRNAWLLVLLMGFLTASAFSRMVLFWIHEDSYELSNMDTVLFFMVFYTIPEVFCLTSVLLACFFSFYTSRAKTTKSTRRNSGDYEELIDMEEQSTEDSQISEVPLRYDDI